jgi:hypothetical protein
MKERPELLTADEYNEICTEMLAFQEANNRLSYSDSESEKNGDTAAATVEDKSFTLTEAKPATAENVPEEAAQVPPGAEEDTGFVKSVINFFGR